MKKNIGGADKAIRVIAALLVAILYFTNVISGTTALILGAVALIFALTSFIGFCPLYPPFGINTAKKKK